MPFAHGPQLAYAGRGRYVTVGTTVYVGANDVITIPGGFATDLASVPRLFWWLLPPHGAYEAAAVLHDWCCVDLARAHRPGAAEFRARHGYDRAPATVGARDADGLFRRVMREQGVGVVTRWLMWTGVRWGALANPARRSGWWREAPLVAALTLLVLLAAGAGLTGVHLLVNLALRALP